MTGFIVVKSNGCGYLERIPFDGSYRFLAATAEHATVFSESVARRIAQCESLNGHACEVWPDRYWKREPAITELPAQYWKVAVA